MDLTKYLIVLVVLCLEDGETGGGGKHHDHVKLHIPEFHHHDHHKKVITIHHHHHPPKKEHHHHIHHHHKPQVPHGYHYNRHHKKVHLKTHTVSKGAGHHGFHSHHGNHQKHHGHHGHHGHHHGHQHGHHDHPGYSYHYDAPVVPTVSYTPNAIPTYEDEFIPSVPTYDSGNPITGFSAPQIPQVRGVTHTVKQVKVFDSLPGALPNKQPSNGYEVTEEGEEGEEALISLNNLQNTYPATFGYVRSAASQPTNDPFGEITSQIAVQQTQDPFASAPVPTAGGIESFAGTLPNEPFPSSIPTQSLGLPLGQSPSVEYPVTFREAAFDEPMNSLTGSGLEGPSFISNEENNISNDAPVTFTREAGIQQTTKTGNVETLVY